MATLFQVGAGSGGMIVLDLLCREPGVERIILIEPDIYKPHNVHRHFFGPESVGRPKVELAAEWVRRFRPEIELDARPLDLRDLTAQAEIDALAAASDLGVCAVDNEPAKYHFDGLMRKHGKRWTLGEVLSGGIGGWVHAFRPGESCYGCVASHLQRAIETDDRPMPDYSSPGAGIPQAAIPASKSAITVIAGLHARASLDLLAGPGPDFTSFLLPLAKVDGLFEQAWRPFRFRIPRSPECLICGASSALAGEDLDVALDQALARLGHE